MLTREDTRQLDRLVLAGGSTPAAGTRVSRARGFGLEFRDYRPYLPGDDPRSIDWTVDARLRQLVVRVFASEGHTPLHLLLDTSGSMSIGHPSKLTSAARLAAALAYVAVAQRDPVGMATFDSALRSVHRPATGRRQLQRVIGRLAAAQAQGPSALDDALVAYGELVKGPGLVVLLSDWLGSSLPERGLSYLLYRGVTPVVAQVLAPEDASPAIDDDVELVDSEMPMGATIVATRDSVRDYLRRLNEVETQLARFCGAHGLAFVQCSSAAPLGETITRCLHAGVVATRS